MRFEILINKQYLFGVMARTSEADGQQIIHLLSRQTGLWILVTQQQLDEQDIPAECLIMVQELVDTTRVEPNFSGG